MGSHIGKHGIQHFFVESGCCGVIEIDSGHVIACVSSHESRAFGCEL